MTYENIIERMKDLSKVTPADVVRFYGYLAALLAEKSQDLAESMAEVAQLEAKYIEEGESSASAETKAQASPEGLKMLKLKAGLKGCEEMIRCLKKAQQYYADEARNLY